MELKRLEVMGTVSRSVRNAAYKSEYDAVVLIAEDGETYVLCERDATPFERVVGQEISASRIAAPNGTLIVDDWHKLN